MRHYRGSSDSERRAARRTRLVDAAISVYGAEGRPSASVRRICQAAGLSERYLYESFPNGDALFAATFDYAGRAFEYQLLGCRGDRRAMLATYFDALRRHPAISRVFVAEIPAAEKGFDALVEDVRLRVGRIFCGVSADRTLSPAERMLLVGVAGGLFHIGRLWLGEDFATPFETVVDAADRLCSAFERIDDDD